MVTRGLWERSQIVISTYFPFKSTKSRDWTLSEWNESNSSLVTCWRSWYFYDKNSKTWLLMCFISVVSSLLVHIFLRRMGVTAEVTGRQRRLTLIPPLVCPDPTSGVSWSHLWCVLIPPLACLDPTSGVSWSHLWCVPIPPLVCPDPTSGVSWSPWFVFSTGFMPLINYSL
jgi:hypothetical protein